jgi:hypothetical protein
MLDVAASKIHDSLSRDSCVSSTQLNRPSWRKKVHVQLENPKMQEVFFSKTNQVFTGKQYARCPCF